MKLKNQISIGIVCLLLGVILSLQYKVFQNTFAEGLTPFKRQTELTNELITLREEKAQLNAELTAVRAKINDIETAASQDNAIIKNLSDKLKNYEILAGMTNVSGEGIVITIDNPPVDSNSILDVNVVNHYEEIVKLINDLNAAGAEAISINDQRITALSEIRAAGSSINVNYVPQTVPIVIKAIGKSSALEAALTYRFGQVTRLRDASLLVDVKTMDEVIIPRFHGVLNFQYAETIEEN
ncbi:MAG: DUF881 domain-containing protein [Clostridia bacterium]|nr:DUF881 domain-containing protein [Clostridia bacterium]